MYCLCCKLSQYSVVHDERITHSDEAFATAAAARFGRTDTGSHALCPAFEGVCTCVTHNTVSYPRCIARSSAPAVTKRAWAMGSPLIQRILKVLADISRSVEEEKQVVRALMLSETRLDHLVVYLAALKSDKITRRNTRTCLFSTDMLLGNTKQRVLEDSRSRCYRRLGYFSRMALSGGR